MEKFLEIKNKQEWQKLLDKALFKTFFHSLEWEGFLEKEFKWLKFKRFIWKDQALISLAEVSGKKLISHPFCEYGGILPIVTLDDFAINEIFRNLKNLKTPIQIRFHSFFKYFFPNFQRVFKKSNLDTYLIENFEQINEEEIWNKYLRKTTRQEIKKAKKLGVTTKKCENKKELRDFYNIYLSKAKEHKIPAYPFSFFDYFLKSNQAEIMIAVFRNEVVGGSVFLKYQGILHYFINASNSQKAKGINHLILWNEIKNYCGKEFKVFDFGGTKRGASLAVFKKGWGAVPNPIYELKSFSSDNKNRYSILRNIWGILPKSFIKALSPYFLKYKL